MSLGHLTYIEKKRVRGCRATYYAKPFNTAQVSTKGGCSGVHQSSYLEPEFTERCEFGPAWDPHGRRFLRSCLIDRSEFRSSNGSFR